MSYRNNVLFPFMQAVKRAIIVAGGLGTRFLPSTMTIPKEMLHLVDRPVLHYLVDEATQSGISEICLVVSPEKEKAIKEYFTRDPRRDGLFLKKDRSGLVGRLCETCSEMRISFAMQPEPLGNGDALLRVPREFQQTPCAVLFGDDLWQGPRPALRQLCETFDKVEGPVLALSRVPQERVEDYGIAMPKKIDGRLISLRDIIEKPKKEEAPSNLAVVGKYVITPEVFEYLKSTGPDIRGEIQLANAFHDMLRNNRQVYGYELEGEWIPCGDRLDFVKSTVKLAVAHPDFGEEFRKFLQSFKA